MELVGGIVFRTSKKNFERAQAQAQRKATLQDREQEIREESTEA
jgi:hypothetical protein